MFDPSAPLTMTVPPPVKTHGQRSLAVIVLTDAVAFSARMSEDEESTLMLIDSDLTLIETLCRQFEGRVIKSTGDGLLMYFVSAIQAVKCCLEIQRQLSQNHEKHSLDKPLQHRIGVHLGDIFHKDSDVMGNGVNIAARLQTAAHPGGICISQTVYDVVKSRLSLNAIYAGELQLKNIQQPQPAYHLYPDHLYPDGKTAKTTAQSHQSKGENEQGHQEIAPRSQSNPALPSTPRDCLEPGSKVGGRYQVQRVLGQGGFGRSYLVEDIQRFGELCVLKEFFPSSSATRNLQKALDLFKREAKTLYQINHPQIPQFMACFTQGKRLFIVQEYINGITYAQLLRQRKREGQCFSVEEVIRWLIHMLQVLDYLHSLKVVHRDISPDNIMYCQDRNLPVLIDFGLVNDAMSDILSANVEREGAEQAKAATIVGKFGYSPPEQLQMGQCFPSSDLYALGITAIVLLTGKYPRALMHQGSWEWDWQQHIELPSDFAEVLNRMTRQQPRDRFQSAREVLEVAVELLPNAHSPLPQPFKQPINLLLNQPAVPLYDAPLQRGRSVTRDADFIDQCRQELTCSIGPIATVLIDDILEENPYVSPQELVALLAGQLSDGDQADDFTSRIYANASFIESQKAMGQPPTQKSGTNDFLTEVKISPEFLNRCRQALSQSIGPIADFLIEETLADYPNLSSQDLVMQLATEIPDPQKALEFQQRLLKT